MKPNLSSVYLSRSSLVANYLRQQLLSGKWSKHPFAERALSEQIGMSRRTLRTALDELQQEA